MDNKVKGLLKLKDDYYFQARIPKDCLAHYSKAIFKEKLPTQNRKEAVALVAKRWVDFHEAWDIEPPRFLRRLAWFNHHRLLEPIGYIPPVEAEVNYYRGLSCQTMLA